MSDIPIKLSDEKITGNGMGFLSRVTGIIVSPERVMESLAARPRIIFPLILTAVSLPALFASRLSLYEDFLRQSTIAGSKFTESLTGIKMTSEMLEQSISKGLYMSLVTTPLGALFGWLLITVIFFAIFKIAGGKGRFKQYFSVTGYSYVIMTLYYIIVLGASFFTGSLHQDISLTSIANLLGSGMRGKFLFGVLKGMDIFAVWYYTVMAIGFTKVSCFKKSTVYGIVAGVFIIGLLIAGAGEVSIGALM